MEQRSGNHGERPGLGHPTNPGAASWRRKGSGRTARLGGGTAGLRDICFFVDKLGEAGDPLSIQYFLPPPRAELQEDARAREGPALT